MAMRTTTTTARKTNSARGTTQGTQTVSARTLALRNCADVCHETITYCLEQGGDHVQAEHIRCLIDTAEICMTTANAVARESDHANDLLEICAQVCDCTADSCADFEDDAPMEACAEACRQAVEFARRE